jgi:hypothetical protein
MKRLVLTGVLLFVIFAGVYYYRGLFLDTVTHQIFYQYTLQSNNLDDLRRFAPMIEAQMRGLAALKDVSLNSQIKSDRVTISFSLAPKVALADAIAQIHDMEIRLALPPSITASLAKAE